LEFLGECPCLLEELLKVGLAVQDTIHGRVAANLQGMQTHVSFSRSENPNANVEVSGVHAYRERPLAVAALEACLVVGDPVGGEEVDEVHGLVAGFALVLRAGERHGFLSANTPARAKPLSLYLSPWLASRLRCARPSAGRPAMSKGTARVEELDREVRSIRIAKQANVSRARWKL